MRCSGYHYVPESSLEDAKDDPRIGSISAEKYVILGLINEGGMGAVYRALQMPVEREVAVKVLRTELTDSDQAGDRFIREARAVSRLNHPNIITLYDFGFDSNRHPYMVMEYAPGDSLAKWIRNPTITLERIVSVTHQILSALSEAHNQGIVHRDLKPDNMIVSSAKKKDNIKLLDFGIARLINEGATRSLTREGEVFGTPHYMAPEQAQGKKNVGPPADIYAMGIMLYEMIVGQCPFDAPTPLAVLFMHINEPLPEVIPRENVVVPELLAQILAKATSKDADDRFQDANEMMLAVEDLIAVMSGNLTNIRDLTGEIQMSSFSADASSNFATAKTQALTDASHSSDLTVSPADRSYEDESKSNKALWVILGLLFVSMIVVGAVVLSSDDTGEQTKEIVEKIEPEKEIIAVVPDKALEEKETLAKIELEKKKAAEKEEATKKAKALENANLENSNIKNGSSESDNKKTQKPKKKTKKPNNKIAKKVEKKTEIKTFTPPEKKEIKKKKESVSKFKKIEDKKPMKFKSQ